MRWKFRYSDKQIIDGLRKGGTDFEKFSAVLYHMCRGYIHKSAKKYPTLSQENLHDAYIDALDAVIRTVLYGKFRVDSSKLSTFLYQLYSNKCIDQLRALSNHKSEWEKTFDSITEDLPASSRDFLYSLMDKDEVDNLVSEMEKLGDHCKDLIMDFDYWGFKPDEVAKRRGYKSGKSASQAKFRCIEELRKLIVKREKPKSHDT